MADGKIIISTKIDQSGFKAGAKDLKAGLTSLKGSLGKLAAAAGVAFSVAAIVNFGKASVKAANDLENAMTGLKSVADGMGKSFENAKNFIQEYISDGLISATEASTAYKNLLLRGYDDTQIQSVLVALKDSAAYGRQSSYTLGQAVQTATEGLKNENSILVDNAGVTKNVAKMWDDYAKSIGTTSNNLTQQQKIQAEVLGILEETKFQTGDAAKVANSFSGQLMKLQFSFNNLKIAVGNAIKPIATAVLPYINALITGLTRVANLIAQISTALFGKQAAQQQAVAKTGVAAADSQNELAKATTKAGKAAKKALAPFDELNILQSGSGGGSDSPSDDAVTAGIGAISGELGSDVTVSPKLQQAIDTIKAKFESLKQKVKEVFAPSFKAWGDAFTALKTPISKASDSIKQTFSGLKENALKPLAGYILTDFIPSIVNAYSEKFAPIFESVVGVALEEFAKDFEFASTQVKNFVNNMIIPALDLMKEVAVDVFDGIKKAWDKYGEGILDKFGELKEGLRRIWESLYNNLLEPAWSYLSDTIDWLWTKHLKPLWDNITLLVGSVIDFVLVLWNRVLQPLVEFIVNRFGPPIANIIGFIGAAFGTVIGVISDLIGGMLRTLRGLLDFITGVFTGDWKKAWGGIKDFFGGIWDGLWGIVKGVINQIIDGLNLLWGGVYSTVAGIVNGIGGIAGTIGKLFGKEWSFRMSATAPKIPKLATGAVIPPRSEFLAILGDQRQGRNIETPESLLRQIFREELGRELGQSLYFGFKRALAEAGGVGSPEVNVFIGNDQIDALVERANRRNLIRNNGR